MIAVGVLGLLTPLLSLVSYRHAGARWGAAAGLAVLALVLSLGAAALALFYLYAIDISAGLCGHPPVLADVAAVVAYLVVAAWAARSPRRVWAWPLAIGVAASVLILVSYFFTGAHSYCET